MKPRSQAQTKTRQQRSLFLAFLLHQLLLVTPDPTQIDHQSRADQHLRHSNLTTNRQLPGLPAERMRHTADGALDGCSPVVARSSCLGSPLTQQGDLHLTKAHVQRPPTTTLHRTSRAPFSESTGLATSLFKVSYEAVRFATRLDLRLLPPWAFHGQRRTILVYLPGKPLQPQTIRRCPSAANVRRDMLNLLLSKGFFRIRAIVSAIGPQIAPLCAPSVPARLPPPGAHHPCCWGRPVPW